MNGEIKITLPDTSIIKTVKNSSVYEIIGQIGKGLQKAALVAGINDRVVDLSYHVDEDAGLKVFTFDSSIGKSAFWHSGSHLLAQAVKRLFPGVKLGIGPSIENGFYYDFDFEKGFTTDDINKIESEMKRLVDEDVEIVREDVDKTEALNLFESLNEPYKVELINDIKDDKVSIYRQGNFIDLCAGPHLMRTSLLKSFKILSIAGAYWRGDERNKMLQRIYGIAFPNSKELKNFIQLIEEAKLRDHRKLGNELNLFSFENEIGAGLPLWHPDGALLRFVIDKFCTLEHIKRGYKLFSIPHIAKVDLWKTSGHWDFYHENMYSPIKIDNQDYILKPMNCPAHIKIFKSRRKSYRDLPYRGFEMGTVYRYERSGVLHGLTRVRGFTQDDAHIFCTEEQLEDEIKEVINFTFYMLDIFGFSVKKVYLSTKPEKAVGSDENWDISTEALKKALMKNNIPYEIDPGAGVFYGPKIDIKINDALQREWQCSTIQVDFNLPERFDITYIGFDGQKKRPIMIHRALLGSLERFIGILIEHYAGKFPLWLSPAQLLLLNVGDGQREFTEKLRDRLLFEEIRAEIDVRDETMGYKVREAIARKVPYIGVIGKREAEANTISVRKRGEISSIQMGVEEFCKKIKDEIKSRI